MPIYNVPSLKPRRKERRATLTPAEIRLWQALQQRQLENLKFRRQHSIGPFIVDFYCPSAKRVVELNGSAHDSDTAWRRDEQRTAYLVNVGLSVVRFENRDVMENLEGALSEIRQRACGWQEKL
jgi:very-short-patch-repair endonuclease